MNGLSSNDRFAQAGLSETDMPKEIHDFVSEVTSESARHDWVNSGEQANISFEQNSGNTGKHN